MKNVKNLNVLIIILMYLFLSIFLSIKCSIFFYNILNPIFWMCIFIYFLFDLKNFYFRFHEKKKNILYFTLLINLYIIIYFSIGFKLGFVKSPYNHDFLSTLKNIFINVIPILGIEMTRIVLITKNKKNRFMIIFVTIILFLLELDFNNINALDSNKEKLFRYFCKYIFPLIATGSVCSYIVQKQLSLFPFKYIVLTKILLLLLPIYPNLNWFVEGSLGVIWPFIIYFLSKSNLITNKEKNNKNKLYEKIIYIFTVVFSLLLSSFMIGIFKYKAITILSDSMNPIYSRGDIVIYKEINSNELKQIPNNSIIVYSLDNKVIVHRIIDKQEKGEEVYYKTKGDNNSVEDKFLVSTNQIKGIYVSNIKYLGFPSIWLYEFLNNE